MAFKTLHGHALGYDSDNGGLMGRVFGDLNIRRGALKRTTITSAQLLALFGTPISILAAPPAGYVNILNRIILHKPAGTAYAGIAAGEDLVVKYTDASGAQISSAIEATGFLDSVAVQTRTAGPIGSSGATAGDAGALTAAAMVLHLLVGEITTGTGGLVALVDYDRYPLAFTA